jgi:hypothetical protein
MLGVLSPLPQAMLRAASTPHSALEPPEALERARAPDPPSLLPGNGNVMTVNMPGGATRTNSSKCEANYRWCGAPRVIN